MADSGEDQNPLSTAGVGQSPTVLTEEETAAQAATVSSPALEPREGDPSVAEEHRAAESGTEVSRAVHVDDRTVDGGLISYRSVVGQR